MRFSLDDCVDLGDGLWRHQVAGEELYRIRLAGLSATPWIEERRLAEIELYGGGVVIETMVVAGAPPVAAPDPRQLELPISVGSVEEEECFCCGATCRELAACFGCDNDFCRDHVLEHEGCGYGDDEDDESRGGRDDDQLPDDRRGGDLPPLQERGRHPAARGARGDRA